MPESKPHNAPSGKRARACADTRACSRRKLAADGVKLLPDASETVKP